MTLTVLIPFRSLSDGKSRLRGVLSSHQREDLCKRMLRHTLRLAKVSDRTLVISDDRCVAEILRNERWSAEFLLSPFPGDLNQSLDHALRLVAPESDALILPSDLVHLDDATLSEFLASRGLLTIAPDSKGEGTNLFYIPASFKPQVRFEYGDGSFLRHLQLIRSLSRFSRVFRSTPTGFDLDDPCGLTRFNAQCAADLRVASSPSALTLGVAIA